MKNQTKEIIIATIGIILLISSLTIFILKIVMPRDNLSKKANTELSAAETLKTFKISSLSNNEYTKQNDTSALLKYKLDKETFGISISTKNTILFSTTKVSKEKDTTIVQTQTTDFMDKRGLIVSKPKIYNPSKELKYKTFENTKTVCQLLSTDKTVSSGQSHFHQLSCIDKSDISNQYASIKKLLTKDKTPQVGSSFVQALVITNSKNNIKYSILNLNSDTKRQRLLFASVDEKWEYLGDLIGGGEKYANEKNSITPELQTKINNSKYKGFLAENLIEKPATKK